MFILSNMDQNAWGKVRKPPSAAKGKAAIGVAETTSDVRLHPKAVSPLHYCHYL